MLGISGKAVIFISGINSSFMHVVTLHLRRSSLDPEMAQPFLKVSSRRFCQQSTPFFRASNPIPRNFRGSPFRRNFATGEKGPNPIPGKSPFKIWPFVAITLVGSGAYILMVNSRAGT